MAQRQGRIVASEDVMGGEPRIRGRRISVRQIAELVEEGDVDPRDVAERYDLDLADVYRALTYYHEHPDEMRAVAAARARREREAPRRGTVRAADLE